MFGNIVHIEYVILWMREKVYKERIESDMTRKKFIDKIYKSARKAVTNGSWKEVREIFRSVCDWNSEHDDEIYIAEIYKEDGYSEDGFAIGDDVFYMNTI